MFVSKTFEEMLAMLYEPVLEYYDFRCGTFPMEALSHKTDDLAFWTNLPSSQVSRLYRFFEGAGLMYFWNPVSELVGNAARHGNYCKNFPERCHNGDPMKSMSVKVFTGTNGFLVHARSEG